jgi:hypothetical protein
LFVWKAKFQGEKMFSIELSKEDIFVKIPLHQKESQHEE